MSEAAKFTIGHLFAGMGGGAKGAQEARVRIGDTEAYFETVGGVDIDPGAAADFEYLTGTPCAVADIHTMQPAELRAAMGDEAPDMILLSPPCKGFSALLSKAKSKEKKYQELNQLVLKGLFLVCSTWDKPPAIIFIENVPRITSRGAPLLEKARQLLRAHGYEVTENDYHDCGEIGGLAQHRRRFFMVARDPARVPNFVYRPGKLRVKACGEVLGDLPMPEDPAGGPLHRMPRISWLNWVRLALIPAGGDWRDLPGVVPDGKQRREVHRRHTVSKWDEPTCTVAGPGSSGAANVADPRPTRRGKMSVADWGAPAKTVTGVYHGVSGGTGQTAVADPRLHQVLDMKQTGKGAKSFKGRPGLLGVQSWDEPTGAVTSGATVSGGNGTAAVADPRLSCQPRSGAYGVLSWEEAAAAITGSLQIDNGKAAIADPRKPPDFIPVIIAEDGTWHRPLTTLELAALQGFPTEHNGRPLELSGTSSTAWRERIGNAIPPPAAQAVASEILLALLASREKTFVFRLDKVWVKDAELEPEWMEVTL